MNDTFARAPSPIYLKRNTISKWDLGGNTNVPLHFMTMTNDKYFQKIQGVKNDTFVRASSPIYMKRREMTLFFYDLGLSIMLSQYI